MPEPPSQPPERKSRLIEVTLDERAFGRHNANVEHEREVAIFDLLDSNSFELEGRDDGPYKLVLSITEDRLVFNIGNDGEFTVRQLAELVLEVTGSGSEIVHEELPVDDPKQRRPDLTIARTKLGWSPTVDLRDGLTRTAAYFEQVLRR